MFVSVNNTIINSDHIQKIDLKVDAGRELTIQITSQVRDTWQQTTATGQQAVDVIMRLCPSAIEGKRLKYAKRAWMVHNLLAHPAMQILAMFGRSDLGVKIHDGTIPLTIRYNRPNDSDT